MSQTTKKITSITELTFGQYVDLVLGDISVLGYSEGEETEANTTKQIVLAEFSEMTGDMGYLSNVHANFNIAKLTMKVTGLTLAAKVMEVAYHPDTFKYLQDIFVIRRNEKMPETLEELNNVIQRINIEKELRNIDLQEALALQEKQKTGGSGEQATRKTFVRMLATVSQYVKFNVDFTTNAGVVATYLNSLREYNEAQQSKQT